MSVAYMFTVAMDGTPPLNMPCMQAPLYRYMQHRKQPPHSHGWFHSNFYARYSGHTNL